MPATALSASRRPQPLHDAKRRCVYALLSIALLLIPADRPAAKPSIETAASHAIVLDAGTGAVLLEKNADEAIPPASMSKLMTAAMTFEALQQGRLELADRFTVSESAFRKEGSTMFLNLNHTPTVEDLLRGVIVQSGNDASIALAEGLAGSEEAFAAAMTRRAAEIGLTQSTFRNATGLPHPEHRMSVRDLATLATYMIDSFPEYYRFYQERDFTWDGVTQRNRNPLLYLNPGGDGLKTGHTEEAGYGMVGSAARDGRRVVAVVTGLRSQRARTLEIQRIMSWAFREFRTVTIGRAGDVVGEAEVWIGAEDRVPVVLADDLEVTLPYVKPNEMRSVITYQGPIPAPIAAGQAIGELRLEINGALTARAPVVAGEDVALGGFAARYLAVMSAAGAWIAERIGLATP